MQSHENKFEYKHVEASKEFEIENMLSVALIDLLYCTLTLGLNFASMKYLAARK